MTATVLVLKVWMISGINSGNLCSIFILEIINADIRMYSHKILHLVLLLKFLTNPTPVLFMLEQSDKNTYL
jgi:hypothetical protein